MRRLFLLLLIVPVSAALWFSLRGREQADANWKTVAPGVEMRQLTMSENGYKTLVTAFRARANRVQIATGASLNADGWRQRAGAIVALNGGYFDTQNRSLGLRIAKGRRITGFHGTRWGVFRLKNGRAAIVSGTDAREAMGRGVRYQHALQCGPILVSQSRIGSFKEQWARRSGIGVTRDNRVVVAVADSSVTLKSWAQIFRDRLNCPDALNLDGGSSTQLSLRATNKRLEIRSGRAVPDAVIIR